MTYEELKTLFLVSNNPLTITRVPALEYHLIAKSLDAGAKGIMCPKIQTKEQAEKESGRCMSCGLCFDCNQCAAFCPQDAISRYKQNPVGEVMYTHYTKCVGCHICQMVCPTGYIQMGMGDGL